MRTKIDETKHSMKVMWGCVTFAVVAIVLVANGVGGGALFLIPCMVMMGAMMWMMMGGTGGQRRGAATPAIRLPSRPDRCLAGRRPWRPRGAVSRPVAPRSAPRATPVSNA